MATREEMGKALFSSVATSGELAWERLTEQARELWCQSAEKFAAWLREQDGEQEYRRQFEERCGRWFDRALPDSMPMANSTPCPHCGGIAIHRTTCPTRPKNLDLPDAIRRAAQFYGPGLYEACEKRRTLTCPKGHVLTHPEDIARRFCGTCREFLP